MSVSLFVTLDYLSKEYIKAQEIWNVPKLKNFHFFGPIGLVAQKNENYIYFKRNKPWWDHVGGII